MAETLCEIPLPGRMIAPDKDRKGGNGAATTLPSFVAGPENQLVAGTISRLIESASTPNNEADATTSPTILALFGVSGTGKTHLASGLVEHWQKHRGANSARYLTAADFRREFDAAMDSNEILKFRDDIRGRQVLAIDGLHQLPAGESLLQELRYTLDSYEDDGGMVLVTSDRPASFLGNLPPDVRSRVAAGLVLELAPPGDAARLRLIQHASSAMAAPISEDAADSLARGLSGTANEVFGVLFELIASSNGDGHYDAASANRLLADRAVRRPTLPEIISVVAKYSALPQKQLKSSTRKQAVVFARALAVYLARELSDASYEEIGRALGGRDHTTIIHSFRKIERERQRDTQIRDTLENLRRILLSR